MALLADFFCQSFAQGRSIDGVDRVEKRYRVLRLIRLQWADEMQFDTGIFRTQWRPLRFRLLNAIFAKNTLAGSNHRLDNIRTESLRNRNQGHFRWITLGIAARAGDLCTNMFETVCSEHGHALAISHRIVDRHFK